MLLERLSRHKFQPPPCLPTAMAQRGWVLEGQLLKSRGNRNSKFQDGSEGHHSCCWSSSLPLPALEAKKSYASLMQQSLLQPQSCSPDCLSKQRGVFWAPNLSSRLPDPAGLFSRAMVSISLCKRSNCSCCCWL